MNKRAIIFALIIAILPVLLIGCGSKAAATPTIDPNLIYTAAAETANARVTQIFASTPSPTAVTPSPTIDPLTLTQAAQTAAARLTQTAAVSPTAPITATRTPPPTGAAGDGLAIVSDVTIPDGTIIAPGATFTKTWKVQNSGITTWSTSYSLVFISGDPMGNNTIVPVGQSVPPGQQTDLSVVLTAPTKEGTYQGYWKMKNASGSFFNDVIWVQIVVGSGGATPTPTQGTPGATPTPTATGSPSNPITNLSMSVDNPSYQGACPHTLTFTALVTLSQGATLTYHLEAESSTPGFHFDLPAPETRAFNAGENSIVFYLEFTDSVQGWVAMRVTSPVNESTNQANFTFTCTP